MKNALIVWDGKHNVVVISDRSKQIAIPLDDFIALPAVRYVMELAWRRRRGQGRHEDDCDYVRWCFADPKIAAAFAVDFGGTVLTQC